MKLFFLIFSFLSFCAHGQEYKFDTRAIYKLTCQPDINNPESTTELEMELLIGNQVSLFQALKQRQKDSILFFQADAEKNVYSKGGGIVMRPVRKFDYKVLKLGSDIRVFDSAFGVNMEGKEIIYEYKEQLFDQKWEIKEETKTLQNVICQRADLQYGGRSWTAWFAQNIPIQDGPYKFGGLPGIIVKISDATGTWDFELISLRKENVRHAINFQNWYIMQKKSKEELYRDRQQFQQQIPVLLKNAVAGNMTDEEYQIAVNRFLATLEKDNNWIELIP